MPEITAITAYAHEIWKVSQPKWNNLETYEWWKVRECFLRRFVTPPTASYIGVVYSNRLVGNNVSEACKKVGTGSPSNKETCRFVTCVTLFKPDIADLDTTQECDFYGPFITILTELFLHQEHYHQVAPSPSASLGPSSSSSGKYLSITPTLIYSTWERMSVCRIWHDNLSSAKESCKASICPHRNATMPALLKSCQFRAKLFLLSARSSPFIVFPVLIALWPYIEPTSMLTFCWHLSPW